MIASRRERWSVLTSSSKLGVTADALPLNAPAVWLLDTTLHHVRSLRHLSEDRRRSLTVSVVLSSIDMVPQAANLWHPRRTLSGTISRLPHRSVDGSKVRGLRG